MRTIVTMMLVGAGPAWAQQAEEEAWDVVPSGAVEAVDESAEDPDGAEGAGADGEGAAADSANTSMLEGATITDPAMPPCGMPRRVRVVVPPVVRGRNAERPQQWLVEAPIYEPLQGHIPTALVNREVQAHHLVSWWGDMTPLAPRVVDALAGMRHLRWPNVPGGRLWSSR